jgi:hypothetical protein
VIVSFDVTEVVSTNSLGEEPVTATIPTISRVDYNTILGDNMIVFGHMKPLIGLIKESMVEKLC